MRSAVAGIPEREEWRQVSGSTLTHHGPCCDRARAWLTAMGRSYDFSSTDGLAMAGPRWITQRWAWGPTRWPIAWCEAVRAEVIDCGVFGAFALELFRAKASTPIPASFSARARRSASPTGGASGKPCPPPSTGSARASCTTR